MPEELSDFSECFITGTAQPAKAVGGTTTARRIAGHRDGATF
jgi:hypothetical protein